MTKRWTSPAGRLAAVVKRAGVRHGITASIIAIGAVVAAGSLHHTHYLTQTPLVARVAASDSAATAKLNTLLSAAKPGISLSSPSAGPSLDNGVDHARVDLWVSRLSTGMRDGFEVALGRMGKYAGMIDQKLAARQMPHDLIYLAMIESEFNPNAKSPVHAVGLWQFMKGTAERFGLRVRGGVDERKDPARATDAALAYLSDLHDRFGSWYLAAAAYNSGEGTVLHAMKRVLGRSTGTDDDFFRILPALPKETQDYVPKLIAASRIGNAPAQYGVVPRDVPPAPVKQVKEVTSAPTAAHHVARHSPHKKTHKAVATRHIHRSVKRR
jgi:soluble lytic murein transglycosylase-like protein